VGLPDPGGPITNVIDGFVAQPQRIICVARSFLSHENPLIKSSTNFVVYMDYKEDI
jgi:hypothetical protein